MVQLQTYQDTASYPNWQAMRIVNAQNKQASFKLCFLQLFSGCHQSLVATL